MDGKLLTSQRIPKSSNTLALLLIFINWIAYEWVFFFYPLEYGGPILLLLTYLIKLVFPILLVFRVGIPSFDLLNKYPHIGLYIIFFVFFLAWAIIPTMFYGDFIEFLKLLPRLILFLGTLMLFIKNPDTISYYAKLILGVVLLTLVQYIGNYFFRNYESWSSGYKFIFGSINSGMYFPGIPIPVLRFHGFWNEPSNAAGTAFSSFFFARYLFSLQSNKIWRYASYCSLISGFLCFSNAGYLAFGSALLFGAFFTHSQKSFRSFLKFTAIIGVTSILLLTAIFGRKYVADNYADNDYLRAFVGLREINPQIDFNTAYSGRIDLVDMTLSEISKNPLGKGIQVTGSEGIDSSASAPIFWLYLTGILGLILILSRESIVFSSAIKLAKKSHSLTYLVQAWIVILIQHTSYGSWMNPNYLIATAAVLSFSVNNSKRQVDKYH